MMSTFRRIAASAGRIARPAVLATALATSCAFAQGLPPESAPAATAAAVDVAGGLTRLTFLLTGEAAGNAYVLADPDRVIVDLPEVDFQIDPAVGRARPGSVRRGRGARKTASVAGGLIDSFRFGLFAPGKSRIVVDLASPARIARTATERLPDGRGARLVLELAPTDRASFRAAARMPRPAAFAEVRPAAPVAAQADANERPLVVVDPGHGGVDSGAHAPNGALEKDIVFDFSRNLVSSLEATGRYRVMMTRATDVFVALDERVRIARAAGASLFVSIHADTLSDEPGVAGATVYTVAEKASDAQAARVAEKENQADTVAGFEADGDANGVSDILFDLARRETRAFSHVFARTLVGYFKEVSRLNKNPHRSAGFRVLRAPDVPSVLLEIGYLSSDRDFPNLSSPDWRQKAANNVARAIDRFFVARDGAGGKSVEAPLGLKRGF